MDVVLISVDGRSPSLAALSWLGVIPMSVAALVVVRFRHYPAGCRGVLVASSVGCSCICGYECS